MESNLDDLSATFKPLSKTIPEVKKLECILIVQICYNTHSSEVTEVVPSY